MNVRIQQDASEFLNVAFERLETQLKGTQGEKYLCKNTFNGLQTQILLCNECGNIIEKDEDFFLVSVEVKD